MKILIVTTIHKRYELTKIVLEYYKDLQKSGLDIGLLACGSEGETSRQLAEGCGWDYVEAINSPVAQKHNRLFKEAKLYFHDALMLVGSDDLVSEEIIKHYQNNYTSESFCMVGFNTLHFYSIEKDQAIYFKGYPADHTHRLTMGAGRLFPKAVLEKMNYNLWKESHLNRGLDSVVSSYLKLSSIPEVELKINEIEGAMIVDIKSDTNITEWGRVTVNCNHCNPDILFKKFPKQFNQIKNGFKKSKSLGDSIPDRSDVVGVNTLVSIIMNTFNEDVIYLKQAIDSCLAQELIKVQLIISTVAGDKNIDWIREKYPNVELVVLPKVDHPGRGVSGSYIQINNALKYIKGDWFHFISSNDILYPDKCYLEIKKCLETGKEICYSNFNHINVRGENFRTTDVGEYDHERHLTGNFVSDASLVSRRLIDKYAPFNVSLNNFAFWDMWLRIFEGEGNVFCYNPIPIFDYRVIASSMHIERKKDPKDIEKTKKDRLTMLALHK